MSRKNLYTFISMKYYLAPDSALHSALYSAPDSKIEKIFILVPFQATIDPKNNFTQSTLHSSFISKKNVPSITDAFRNTHLLPHLYQFSQQMKCAIFRINTNLLIIQQNINIFTQETLFHSFISNKNLRSPLQNFLEISIEINFQYFRLWMRCAIFQINTNLLIIQRNVNIFTQQTLYPSFILRKNWRSPSQTFYEHPLLLLFHYFQK